MIIVRIYDGIRDHFPIRASEWLMVYPCLSVGLALYLQPQLFSTSPAYANVAGWMSEPWWSVLFLACAALRLIALTVNGTFHSFRWSPTIRLSVSIITALAFGQFCLGFALEWLDTRKATFLTLMLSHMVLAEILNCYRSSRDMSEASHGRSRMA